MSGNKHLLTGTNELLSKIEADLDVRMSNLNKGQRKTDFLGFFFFIVIGAFSLMNLYFLYDWGLEVKSIVHEMSGTHDQVTIISNEMVKMSHLVKDIESETALIPIMNEEMLKFVESMQQMQLQTQSINHNMVDMNNSFVGISQDVDQMNTQVQGLNQQLGTMNFSISEMSRLVP